MAPSRMLTERAAATRGETLHEYGLFQGFRTLYGTFIRAAVALTLGLPLEYERKVGIVKKYHERIQGMKPLRRAG